MDVEVGVDATRGPKGRLPMSVSFVCSGTNGVSVKGDPYIDVKVPTPTVRSTTGKITLKIVENGKTWANGKVDCGFSSGAFAGGSGILKSDEWGTTLLGLRQKVKGGNIK